MQEHKSLKNLLNFEVVCLYLDFEHLPELYKYKESKPIETLQIGTLCLLINKDNNICIGKKTEEKYNDLITNVCLRKLYGYSWDVFYATHWLPIPKHEEK